VVGAIASWLVFVPSAVSAAPGDLDASFGVGGWVLAAVDDGHTEYVEASALQADGRIVVVGVLGAWLPKDDLDRAWALMQELVREANEAQKRVPLP
jgi:hypothetical protein